ncbi:LOW QUALITY PROTEIN: T-cell surface glycoprotein CD5 [Chiroxiphia lanceolata]|uniref:LOW QUALITY PROTEIN: T-cell surface glycoprotein CD5 n=1 Tax=Chiroxiphia lanceolata TaxID=296741 RepID=UPI0013CE5D7B|nr:LOW QUALITY PROTEIN: T-cell surface glycoprotein CD5 [Chiroxiphia lanceolata]
MEPRLPPLCLLLLLGTWAIPDHGGAARTPRDPGLQLVGGGCRCTGMLEVDWESRWRRVCQDNVRRSNLDEICRRMGCGPPSSEPFQLLIPSGKETHVRPVRCQNPEGALVECHWELGNCTEHVIVSCKEPEKTTPKPPPAPPDTTPEPTGPPRLRLVDGNFSCSGFLELHKGGLWGAVARMPPHIWAHLGTRICQDLRCGTAGHGHREPEPGTHLPVRWEALEPCESHSLLECFNRTSSRGKTPAFVTCSDSQPRVQRRLGSGPTPCEGDIQVFHEGQWLSLCDDGARRSQRGRQLCRELRCGNLTSSAEIREPPSKGVTCGIDPLHLCHGNLGSPQSCSRTRVVCQDSKPLPSGTSAGTVGSICLALLLFLVLLLVCGPPACRRLRKRISKKKQRQWIGPTGLNQTVSFHRSSSAAPRPRGQGGDNDYTAAPPKSSPLSAYPALEGALRHSNPPENSSDSDYDLRSARRV